MKYLKLFEQYGIGDIDYSEIFIDKLKEKFPNGVKCYHITTNDNVESIMRDGLLVNKAYRGNQIIHTLLGEYDIGRLTSNPMGHTVIEISFEPKDYYMFMPEENTYYIDEISDICDDGDCEDNLIYKQYMDVHPDLIGGDITFYEDLGPERLKIVEVDGKKV